MGAAMRALPRGGRAPRSCGCKLGHMRLVRASDAEPQATWSCPPPCVGVPQGANDITGYAFDRQPIEWSW